MSDINQHGVCLTGYADDDGVPNLYDQDEERDGIDAALLWDDDAVEDYYDGFDGVWAELEVENE